MKELLDRLNELEKRVDGSLAITIIALKEIARIYDEEMSVGLESWAAEQMADTAKAALKGIDEWPQK